MAVVGAAAPVFGERPAELRHRKDDSVAHPIAQVGDERADASREVVEPGGQQPLRAALVHVVVPVAGFGKRDLEANVRLGELGDLAEGLPERASRVVGACGGTVLRRVCLLHQPDGVKRLAAGRLQHLVGRGRVLRLERRADAHSPASVANAKLRDLADGKRRRAALQRARERRRKRHRAKGRRLIDARGRERAVEPPCVGAFHSWSARLHVILRVEVRPRVVRRSTRVNHGQFAAVVDRLERRQPRVEGEEAVEIEPGVGAARPGNGDCRAALVIRALAVRHDHVEPIHRAALEDGDEQFLARRAGCCRARKKRRRKSEADQREPAVT